MPFEDAEFSYSLSAIDAVLTINFSTNHFSESSLILYGDGRLEIDRFDNGAIPKAKRERLERRLSPAELRSVMEMVVSHGLVEWDSAALEAQQRREWGRPFPLPADSVRMHVVVVVQDYRRGHIVLPEVRQRMGIRKPSFVAKHFPMIPQFVGLAKLSEWYGDQLALARQEAAR